jgi:hypothetical protein
MCETTQAIQAGSTLPVDVACMKRDLFASISVSDDGGFEQKLLAATLCPTLLHFLGPDYGGAVGMDEMDQDIAR